LAVTARELMTHPVISILHSATLEQVATLMVDRRINPVPVVDDNHSLIGIVSRRDLVRVIARMEAESAATDSATSAPPGPA
jgi:CBS domain-containing protein